MEPSAETLRPIPAGDTSTKSWLPHPLEKSHKYVAPTDSSYRRIPTGELSYEPVCWRGYSKSMVYGILLGALIIGGAGSGWHSNQRAGTSEFPSLYEADIEAVTKGLERNHFSSVDLVKTYIARINEVNDKLRPVIETNPDALDIATALDEERSKGTVRGPMHGIPILIKDTIATKDKMNNTAGSHALVGAKVPSDSTIAKKLREAGAIILGKTNPSEWGSFRIPWDSSNGWSAYGGQTYGAFYPHQDPSGSSSGSAVAASLGLATVTLGGETYGSIIDPASVNNVVGMKPTVGFTSRHLVIPISERMDTIGPLTKTVKDSAYVLQSIVGTDVNDNYTSAIPENVDKDFVGACKRSALKGARLGVPRNVISLMSDNTTDSMIAAFNNTLEVLRSSGATILETDFPAAQDFLNDTLLGLQIMSADFVVNIESYLKQLTHNPPNISTLAELRAWTRQSPLEGYPVKSTGVWDFALENWNNTTLKFWQAYQEGLYYDNEGGLLGTIKRHGLDAVILPSKFSWSFAAVAGAPVVSIPMGAMGDEQPVVVDPDGLVGSAPGIPFGFSFLGDRWSDAKIVGLAYAMEQRTRVRGKVKPVVRPRTELGDVVGRK